MKNKVMSIILAMVLVLNGLVYSESSVFANNLDSKNIETIYIDGIKYNITINEDLNIEVNTSVDGEEFSLEVDKLSGEGNFTSSDYNIVASEYEVTVNSVVNEDNLDVTIEDDIGNVEEIDSLDDLIDDNYEGQMVISGTLAALTGKAVLSALVAALALSAKVIVVLGVTYYAVDRVADKIKNGFIYPALRRNNAVYIAPLATTKSKAINLVRAGKDVYTIIRAHAKSIVISTGLGVTPSENHYYTSKNKGIYFSHFHTANRNGAHSFYGLPKIR